MGQHKSQIVTQVSYSSASVQGWDSVKRIRWTFQQARLGFFAGLSGTVQGRREKLAGTPLTAKPIVSNKEHTSRADHKRNACMIPIFNAQTNRN